MKNIKLEEKLKYKTGNPSFIFPAIAIWGLMIFLILGFLWFLDYGIFSLERYYLLPWCILAGIVVLSPTLYYLYKQQFDAFHPLIFGVWSYIFPAFVFGGVILAFGWANPYYLVLIEDPQYNLPLSLVYVMVGYIGIVVGYALPVGSIFAKKVDMLLPKLDWQPSEVWVPGYLLLLAGFAFNIIGFIQGIIGFQRVDEIGVFDGILFFLLVILTEASLFLWLGIFSVKDKTGIYYITLAILLAIIPLKMALQGNRGSLIGSVILIVVAFQYSGRKLKFKHSVVMGSVLAIALFLGVIYGTAFRNIKGSESRTQTGDYIGQVNLTLEYLSNKDTGEIISQGFQSLAIRIDNLSALGVAVANYEKLQPYEAGFGIENNIINDLYTSFIPRFIWADKPPTSDARAYSDLYFSYSENSFAVTPFGDLLRNFGPIGVPVGMFLIGIFFRWIYTLLIQTPNPALWKKVAYFVLLTSVSYEAFYATIFPTIIRNLFVLGVSFIGVNFVINQVRALNKTKFVG